MGTVRGNLGTVLEHVALISAVQWALKHSNSEDGPLLHVDTHAMAPLNEPVDWRFDFILECLDGQRVPLAFSSRMGVCEYHRILQASRLRWLDGLRNAYPTHFLQAALAAQAYGVKMDAWLFENDSAAVAAGRRAELAEFLSPEHGPALQRKAGLYPGLLEARLAPEPGDFRDPNCWPTADERPGRAMVVFCDPNKFVEHPGGDALHLAAGELSMIRDLLAERYLERPGLTVNVIFIGASVQTEDCNNAIAWWVENFLPNGLAAQRDRWECACLMWHKFGVLVGACFSEGDFAVAFDDMIQNVTVLLAATLFRSGDTAEKDLWAKVVRPAPERYPYPPPRPLGPLRKYLVRVHHHSQDELESDPIPAPEFLEEVSVLARAEKEAAAKAYVQCIGLERERRLIELDAPHVVVANETNIKGLAENVITSSDEPFGQFKYNGNWDTWYFHVEESEQEWRD